MENIRDRITAIIGRLSRAVAAYAVRQARGPSYVLLGSQMYVEAVPPSPHSPIPTATWNLLTERLGRLAQRVRALFARIEAGTLAPPRIRRPAPKPATPRPPAPRLPSVRGWINARIVEAAPCAGELDMLLQDPAMPTLVSAAPQAGRLLRPLCHALAIDLPAWLRLPPRERQRRPEPRASRRPPSHHPERSEGSTLPSHRRPLPLWVPVPPRARKSAP